jgi:hypothetical protein
MVGIENQQAQHVFHYLVTAKHNIERIRQDSNDGLVHLRVNCTAGGVKLIETKVDDWKSPPDDASIDVAVYPFVIPQGIDLNYISTEMFVTHPNVANWFGLGDEVFITGVFRNHYGTERNIPIIRIGNIAAMPEERVSTTWHPDGLEILMEAFIIESRSIGGLSGSPVFLHVSPHGSGKRGSAEGAAEREFYLLGIVHGHFDLPLTETDFDTADDSNKGRKGLHSGMAIVTPAAKLLEVLHLPQLASQREQIIEEKKAPYRGVPD